MLTKKGKGWELVIGEQLRLLELGDAVIGHFVELGNNGG